MRIVVVGAGVVGLFTAVECVRAGAQVELVEQARVPSASAASYDTQRVVRALHIGDPSLTSAAGGLDAQWRDMEHRLAVRFYRRVGVLTAMPSAAVDTMSALLGEVGAPARSLSSADLAASYPQFRFGVGNGAVLEPVAGIVQADRALHAAARWLRGQPSVRIHPHRRVVRVAASGEVHLGDGASIAGDGVVVATGPWSRDLVSPPTAARTTLKRQTVLAYAPASSSAAWSRSPVVLGLGSTHDAWVLPPVRGAPVRLSAHSACRTVGAMTDHDDEDERRADLIRRFGRIVTGFDPGQVTGTTVGHYLTAEPGTGPLLVRLGARGVWAYAACGGMSFKFAPLLAGALADRALGRPPRHTGLAPVDEPHLDRSRPQAVADPLEGAA